VVFPVAGRVDGDHQAGISCPRRGLLDARDDSFGIDDIAGDLSGEPCPSACPSRYHTSSRACPRPDGGDASRAEGSRIAGRFADGSEDFVRAGGLRWPDGFGGIAPGIPIRLRCRDRRPDRRLTVLGEEVTSAKEFERLVKELVGGNAAGLDKMSARKAEFARLEAEVRLAREKASR